MYFYLKASTTIEIELSSENSGYSRAAVIDSTFGVLTISSSFTILER